MSVSLPVFPALPGIGWPIVKRPIWSTRVDTTLSGREVRSTYRQFPVYEFELPINYMTQADVGALQALYLQSKGALGTFLLDVTNDDSATDQYVATGDGTTKQFQLQRSTPPAPNLILKPTFDDGSPGLWQYGGTGYGGLVSITGQPWSTALKQIYRDLFEGNLLRGSLDNYFSVTPGETIIVGAYCDNSGSAYQANIGLTFVQSDLTTRTWVVGAGQPAGAKGVISGTLTVSAGYITAEPWLQIEMPFGATGQQTLWTGLYIARKSSVFQEPVIGSANEVIKLNEVQEPSSLSAPAAPTLSQQAGGTLAATTYYVRLTYVTANGETLASSESSLAVSANNLLVVNSPAAISGANRWNVYVGTASGAETLQAANINIGTNWTEPTTGLVSGAAPPAAATCGWSVSDGLLSFNKAPASGATITWSGIYYYRCRFADDTQDFSQFLAQLYELKALKLRSVL